MRYEPRDMITIGNRHLQCKLMSKCWKIMAKPCDLVEKFPGSEQFSTRFVLLHPLSCIGHRTKQGVETFWRM